MSAYIVAKEHVAYLAAMAMAGTGKPYGGGLEWYHGESSRDCIREGELTAAVEAANMLWKENMISVAHRYSDPVEELPGDRYVEDDITEADVAFQQATVAFEPVQVLKSCNCLEYQSCEHPGWEASEAHAFLQALKDKAVRALPGYERARWGAPVAKAEKAGAL
ncbi:hypothetical protein PDESU_00954 [Pontiella desulfatans]|uniref:Uncharacterized protein n=1 Tax=Pontiella desulfatans TaxID=2750659 RepID=A0A6C2TXR9_PONDE|nr:hypothetical protein [Pontiella desulfatans]VGO12402.1 hypothetical protein PDESU_00954 [Pontiella desulfatans]